MAKAMVGVAYTPLNAANAKVGIGDSITAAAKAQTDLQALVNKTYLGMDGGFPTLIGAVARFQVVAADGVAQYVWNEFLISDGSPGTAWIRFVQSLNGGVAKAAGQVWTLYIDVTMGRNDAAN